MRVSAALVGARHRHFLAPHERDRTGNNDDRAHREGDDAHVRRLVNVSVVLLRILSEGTGGWGADADAVDSA